MSICVTFKHRMHSSFSALCMRCVLYMYNRLSEVLQLFSKVRGKTQKKKSTSEKDPRSPWLVQPANVSNVERSRSHGQSTMHSHHAASLPTEVPLS